MSARALIGAALVWAIASGALYFLSHSAWWLCAMGGLGLLLVIWPGPKPKGNSGPNQAPHSPSEPSGAVPHE
ncbi:MAG TPA: hypothetical protein VL137_11765 [Polyangiaceae bacterium]|nr:hypothetical protein [Polyangiaceae bacterium]